MGTNTYKKRLKAGWNQGKACKGDSTERIYAQEEIRQAILETDADYQETYRKSKRRRNERARLEHRIAYYQKILEERPNSYFADWYREELEKDRKKYAEKYEKQE